MTTEKQKKAVIFCEKWLDITFSGDIDNFEEVSAFLYKYLDLAKAYREDAIDFYYNNFDY